MSRIPHIDPLSPLTTPTYRPTTYGVTLTPDEAEEVLAYIKGDSFDGVTLERAWRKLQEFVDEHREHDD